MIFDVIGDHLKQLGLEDRIVGLPGSGPLLPYCGNGCSALGGLTEFGGSVSRTTDSPGGIDRIAASV